jgi:hypothetical protein
LSLALTDPGTHRGQSLAKQRREATSTCCQNARINQTTLLADRLPRQTAVGRILEYVRKVPIQANAGCAFIS